MASAGSSSTAKNGIWSRQTSRHSSGVATEASRSKASSTLAGASANGSSGAPGGSSSSASVQDAITRAALPGKSTRCCMAT